jgi:hypothetical protein
MFSYLPEVKKVIKLITNKTDDLKQLEEKVNEIVIDDLIKDCILHQARKQIDKGMFIYDVAEEDYRHITDHITLIQTTLLPDITIMACESKDDYRILFKPMEAK